MHDHALPNTSHIANDSSHRALPKSIDARRHRNRPPPARHPLNVLNARTHDPQNPTPHRFDFR